PDAHLEAATVLAWMPGDRAYDASRGVHGSLRRVFVHVRIAEIGQDAIAQELREIATVSRNHARAEILIGVHDLAHLLGICAGRELARAHEVAKHDGELPPFARGRGGLQRSSRHRFSWWRDRPWPGARPQFCDGFHQLDAMAQGEAELLQMPLVELE